jgi:hypothetical protein
VTAAARLLPRASASRALPLALAAALVGVSLLLRLPSVVGYHGPLQPHPFNAFEMAHVGGYSDIAHLYFRDRLLLHPEPYFDYRFEYPVLTGGFVWLASFVHGDVTQYMLASAALLALLGVGAVWALQRIEGANAWILAAAPALAFYALLNWDLLGVCLMVLALVLFQRDRDLPAAAVLALAVSAKVFPIVVLPVVLALRLADRRWRSALWIGAVFTAVTAAVNAPFAIDSGGLRESWLYFFRFTQSRPPRATIWKPLVHDHSNLVTGPLLVAGLAAIAVLAVRARRRPGGTLVPASAASLLWVFATAKVYSPQYALFIFAALALDGTALPLVVAFGLVDALVFTTTFGPLYPGFGPFAPGGVPLEIQWAAYGVRQLLTAGLAAWIVRDRLLLHVPNRLQLPGFTHPTKEPHGSHREPGDAGHQAVPRVRRGG